MSTEPQTDEYEIMLNVGLSLVEQSLRQMGCFDPIGLAMSPKGTTDEIGDILTTRRSLADVTRILQHKARVGDLKAYAILTHSTDTAPDSHVCLPIVSIQLGSQSRCPLEALVPYQITPSGKVLLGQIYLRHRKETIF
jgi:hypothetical protein